MGEEGMRGHTGGPGRVPTPFFQDWTWATSQLPREGIRCFQFTSLGQVGGVEEGGQGSSAWGSVAKAVGMVTGEEPGGREGSLGVIQPS